jgi:hypothetical protein
MRRILIQCADIVNTEQTRSIVSKLTPNWADTAILGRYRTYCAGTVHNDQIQSIWSIHSLGSISMFSRHLLFWVDTVETEQRQSIPSRHISQWEDRFQAEHTSTWSRHCQYWENAVPPGADSALLSKLSPYGIDKVHNKQIQSTSIRHHLYVHTSTRNFEIAKFQAVWKEKTCLTLKKEFPKQTWAVFPANLFLCLKNEKNGPSEWAKYLFLESGYKGKKIEICMLISWMLTSLSAKCSQLTFSILLFLGAYCHKGTSLSLFWHSLWLMWRFNKISAQ